MISLRWTFLILVERDVASRSDYPLTFLNETLPVQVGSAHDGPCMTRQRAEIPRTDLE